MVYWVGLAGIVGLARRSLRRGSARSHLARLLPRRQGKLRPGRLRHRQLHDPPDRSVPRLLPARDLASVPRPDLRPPAPAVRGRARAPRSGCPKIAVWVLGFLAVVGFLVRRAPPDARLVSRRTDPRSRTCTCRSTGSRSRRASPTVRSRSRWASPAAGRDSCLVRDLPRPVRSRDLRAGQARRGRTAPTPEARSRLSSGRYTSWTDHPPPGTWAYRVALSATPVGPQSATDYIAAQQTGHGHGAPVVALR